MDLEERLLKNVFGSGAIAEEPNQEMKQLALVAFDQLCKGAFVAVAIGLKKLLVAANRRGRGLAVAASLDLEGLGVLLWRIRVGCAQSCVLTLFAVASVRLGDTHLHHSSKPVIVRQVNEKSLLIRFPG
jgi:hypothetical protein